ncbi:sensor histidine kinase [Chitinophaga japonensis]|uniref:histidine kinase n=1 Tax=Chitinophaga japonensis TaxID=104662 RepID=A0A562T7I7_CHIJA|nr:HAMP domain-containing sensor histidine kinase [Chitinophaga japonensis]TWI89273.1 two-component system sensor histidine kinase TorS [Chitinophaga japonensis]
MSALSMLLTPLQHSAYIQKLVTERTGHLRLELQRIETFLKAWSHDIGMPIHGMQAAIALLKNVQDSNDLINVLDILNTSCLMLNDIHSNIGDFLNGHTDTVRTENIVLATWLPPVVRMYRPLATAKGIRIDLNMNLDPAFTFNGDKLKLTRVISNLLGNAIKFTPDTKDRAITVRAYSKTNLLYFEVQDEGIGIPEDKLVTIFQPYVQLNTNEPGLGIGLSNCQSIIEQLQGTISVVSKVTEGSMFTITLPL